MRHRVKGKKLNRSIKHRKALFKNLVTTLIERGEVKTTEAKAKAIKGLVDKLITRAKSGTVQARRVLGGFLQRRSVTNKLVDEVAPKTGKRTSGFTRIVRLGKRKGDDAMIVKMQLVDRDHPKEGKPAIDEKKDESKKKSRPEEGKGKKDRSEDGKKKAVPRRIKQQQVKSQTTAGRKADASTQLRGER